MNLLSSPNQRVQPRFEAFCNYQFDHQAKDMTIADVKSAEEDPEALIAPNDSSTVGSVDSGWTLFAALTVVVGGCLMIAARYAKAESRVVKL